MSKDQSLVRASDIGTWSFCHRAWWLAHVKGVAHRSPARLQQGVATHAAHGRSVVLAHRLRTVGFWLMIGGLLLAVLALAIWWNLS